MLDAKKLLDGLLGSSVPGMEGSMRGKAGHASQLARNNPLTTGALAAFLLGTGKGRKLTGSALKVGGMAAIAGLAYKAYQDYQKGQKPAAPGTQGAQPQAELLPPPANTGFHPAMAPQGEAAFAMVIARAMVAAARADGHIDEAERERIAGRLHDSGLGSEAEQFLIEELKKPVDVDDLVKAAQTEEQRVEIYTASRLAIDPETRAERGYLDMLAGRLRLPDALVDHIESTVAGVKA